MLTFRFAGTEDEETPTIDYTPIDERGESPHGDNGDIGSVIVFAIIAIATFVAFGKILA